MLHGSDNLFVAGSVEEHPCRITIDTGSNISIIRPDVLSEQEQTHIQPVSQSIRTVTGEKAPIQGKGDLHVKIGSQEAVHPMWIADIQDECILGLDYLELHGCMVDLADSVLHINGEEVPLQKTSCSLVETKTYRAVLDSTVSLPPHSECVALAKVPGLQSGGAKWGILEPHRNETTSAQGVLVGRTLIDLHQSTAVVRLMNLTGQRRKFKKGTEIANCEPVESVKLSQNEAQDAEPGAVILPMHLKELYERSTAGLTPDRCQQVYNLLKRYSHIFSAGSRDLGRTDVIKQSAGLKLSPKKCYLFQREVKFLGHVVSKDGVAMDPAKVQAVQDWPTPTSATEVKRFLGLCSYYRRYIRGFADIAYPLHQCAEKPQPFAWTSEVNRAFLYLKRVLTEAPILNYPTPDDQFILDTDASNQAVGAVLSQVQNGQERAIAYYSQVMSRPEQQYCTTRKELLAVVKAVKHFHPYLYGRSFVLRTDHAALRWLFSFRLPEGQIARWLEHLQQYDFRIEHRPGRNHGNADALSRRPCGHTSCKHCEQMENREKSQREAESASNDPRVLESLKVATVSVVPADLANEFPWTHTDLLEAQLQDPEIGPVVKWKNEGTRSPWPTVAPYSEDTKVYWSQWDSLCLKEDVLYRIWENPAGNRQILQLLLPKKLRPQVLHALHNTETGGHFGIHKTLGRVRERFYWCQCRRDTEAWCRSCDLCASRKGPPKKIRAPMAQYNVASPMERLAVDVMGPLPVTESGNRYLLIAMDYFSKWPEAYALPNQEATTVAEVL